MLLAIDPGNKQSGYVLVENDLSRVIKKGKVSNVDLLRLIADLACSYYPVTDVAIEMVASYGMPVGKEVFETCVWIGRFWQTCMTVLGVEPENVYRMEEKIALCHNSTAKDSNIRQALIDRFGPVGVKKNQGFFYGFKGDMWAAMAVAVAYHDRKISG